MANLSTIAGNIFADSGIDPINVVLNTGSYSNPSWITALSWTKISDRPTTLAGYGISDAVPSSRTLTINGTSYDLSANRSWTIAAGVSSIIAGTGISVSGSGNITVTNTGVLSINGSTGAITGIITTSNYNSYSPTLTGGGASGTWGINITGTSGSISGFNNPTTAATANTIAYRDSLGDLYTRYFVGGYVNTSDDTTNTGMTYIMAKFGDNYHRSASAAKVAAFISGQSMNIAGYSTYLTSNNSSVSGGFVSWNGNLDTTNNPNSDYWYGMRVSHGDALSYYSVTFAVNFFANTFQYRRIVNGVNQGWITVLDSGNYNSYSPTLGGGGASGTWGISVTGTANSETLATVTARGATTTGSMTVVGSLTVSSNNVSGGGIILADDGDIVDLNDAYCSMRFSSGVRIFSANRGGTPVVTLGSNGAITATGAINGSNLSGTNTGDQTNISGNAATANGANGQFYIDDNYGNSIIGLYSASRYQGVFSMGAAYVLPVDGTSPGNLYGLSWSHPNAGGQAGYLNDHGLLVMVNGLTYAAISSNIWARGNITANGQFNGPANGLTGTASGLSIGGNASTATAAQNATFLTQPNATWGARVQLGGNGTGSGVANIAVVQATDGNLHMDNGLGKSMYLNYYQNGIIYLNGTSYYISANGSQYNGNSATASTASTASTLYASGTLTSQYGSGTIGYAYALTNGQTGLFSGIDNSNSIITVNRHPDNYYSQLGFSSNGNMYYRSFSATPINTSQAWQTLLTSSNYNSYSPTLTGGNASGTWGINITGSANYANYSDYSNSVELSGGNFIYFNGSGFHNVRMYESYGIVMNMVSNPWNVSILNGSLLTGLQAAGGNYGIGNGYFTGDVTAYYSDKRLKHELTPIKNSLNKLISLTGYTYKHNTLGQKLLGENPNKIHAGLIAQEVQDVLPEVVTIAPFDLDGYDDYGQGISKSGESYLTIKYERLVPLLIEAIKEQQIQIEELKKSIN